MLQGELSELENSIGRIQIRLGERPPLNARRVWRRAFRKIALSIMFLGEAKEGVAGKGADHNQFLVFDALRRPYLVYIRVLNFACGANTWQVVFHTRLCHDVLPHQSHAPAHVPANKTQLSHQC